MENEYTSTNKKSGKLFPLILGAIALAVVAYIGFAQPTASDPTDQMDPFEGLVTFLERDLTEEERELHQSEVDRLTGEIGVAESEGAYALHLYFERAFHYSKLGFAKEAYLDYEIVVDGDPGNETAWLTLGQLSIDMGDPGQAEPFYQNATFADPSSITYNALYNYYSLHRTADRFDEIGLVAQEAIDVLGPSVSWYVKLGDWAMEAEDYQTALDAYRQAGMLEPGNEVIQESIREASQLLNQS